MGRVGDAQVEAYMTGTAAPSPGDTRLLPDGRRARCIVVFRGSPMGDRVEYLIVGGVGGEGGWMSWNQWNALEGVK